MNIFEQVYLQIINESSKDVIKYNNFPEDVEFINITKEIPHRYEIHKIILSNHGVKSVNSDDSIHGINYVDLPKWKFFKALELTIYDIFDKKYNEKFDLTNKNKSFRFQNLITTTSNRKNI